MGIRGRGGAQFSGAGFDGVGRGGSVRFRRDATGVPGKAKGAVRVARSGFAEGLGEVIREWLHEVGHGCPVMCAHIRFDWHAGDQGRPLRQFFTFAFVQHDLCTIV